GRLEHLRGSALGFRNLTNYTARSLLETGGFRPRLHPALVKSRSSWGRPKIRRKPATSDLELNLPQVRCWGGSASAARPGTAMRKRSRRPDLVSPFAVDFFAYPLRSVNGQRSTAHQIAQVKHPVALNHHVGILQQGLCVDRPEVALAGPEHDGYDVHPHLVDQARGKHLATDVASGDLDQAVTRKLMRLGHGCFDAVDEVKRRLGVPALGRRPVCTHDH